MAGDEGIARWIECNRIGKRLADGLFKKRQYRAASIAFHAKDYIVVCL